MNEDTAYPRLRAVDPKILAEHGDLAEEALSVVQGNSTADEIVDGLSEKELSGDLIKALAFMLPKREAVWWACLCARTAETKNPSREPSPALAGAEKWVSDQSEESRYETYEKAEQEAFEGPGAWVGLAAFWSGPSLSLPDLEVVRPADFLTGLGVRTALLLLTVKEWMAPGLGESEMLAIGLDIARGQSGKDIVDSLTPEVEAAGGR